jgi:type II secretory pathway predicted ATPase ExeA
MATRASTRFADSTDPEHLWRAGPHRVAIDAIHEAIVRGERLVVLIGPTGVGKTIVTNALVKQLSASGMRIATSVLPVADAHDLRSAIARSLGLPADVTSRDALAAAVGQGPYATIAIDDAHRAGEAALAELGALLEAQPRFAAILTGDETLAARLAAALPSMRPWVHELRPLDEPETLRFIADGIVSDVHPIPTDLARKIWHASGGTPRVIKHLCRRVLEHPGLVDVVQLRLWANRLDDATLEDHDEALTPQGGVVAEPLPETPRRRVRPAFTSGAVVGAVAALVAALVLIPWDSVWRGTEPPKSVKVQKTVTPPPAVPPPPWSALPKDAAPRATDDEVPSPPSTTRSVDTPRSATRGVDTPPSATRGVDTPPSVGITRDAEVSSRRPEKPKPAPLEEKGAALAPAARPPGDAHPETQDPGAVIDWLMKKSPRGDN